MKKRTQNPIYIATTITVYLGLVLVGASPQVLAHSSFSSDTQSRIFELTTKTQSVLSKLKLREENDSDDFPSFSLYGFSSECEVRWCLFGGPQNALAAAPEFSYSNEQILTVSNLPRASI
ncbi:MAG: hypothetical protein IPM63_12440 [Acidobacteriota bacterium]|nr:MAG: hypothetical protein IPM63_12440 [Acidobacteriota bacterium]